MREARVLRASAMTEEVPRWELEFDWHLTNRCNFHCEYCHPQIREVLNRRDLDEPSPDLVVRRFDELGRVCLVHMSGGEPFLFPGFVEVCAGLTRRHFISINTNLASAQVGEFAARVDPARVVKVVAALHIAESEARGRTVEDFAAHYRLLRRAGFDVVALYVLYPPLLDRLEDDLAALGEAGVERVWCKVFKGVWNHKRYPEGYTEAERRHILAHSGEYVFNRPYLEQPLSFKGESCAAGRDAFKVTVTGQVRRCASVATSYGNLYDGTFSPGQTAQPCPAKRVLVLSQCSAYLVDPQRVQPEAAGAGGAR
jgi:MoaA/NifB/PqqE/SkfB family radical SAM enzyme